MMRAHAIIQFNILAEWPVISGFIDACLHTIIIFSLCWGDRGLVEITQASTSLALKCLLFGCYDTRFLGVIIQVVKGVPCIQIVLSLHPGNLHSLH